MSWNEFNFYSIRTTRTTHLIRPLQVKYKLLYNVFQKSSFDYELI